MNNDEWDENVYEYMERLELEYDIELQEEEHINELNERIVQLEKALDKACELLESLSRFTPKGSTLRTKEKWKEVFLKDE